MATIRRFEEIESWQTARELTRLVYSLSNQGMFVCDFGLRYLESKPNARRIQEDRTEYEV